MTKAQKEAILGNLDLMSTYISALRKELNKDAPNPALFMQVGTDLSGLVTLTQLSLRYYG